MDDELTALLIEAHRNIGFLEGLLKYASNKNEFSELMLLKECAYSLMIDYDSPAFQDILVNRGSGKGDIFSLKIYLYNLINQKKRYQHLNKI